MGRQPYESLDLSPFQQLRRLWYSSDCCCSPLEDVVHARNRFEFPILRGAIFFLLNQCRYISVRSLYVDMTLELWFNLFLFFFFFFFFYFTFHCLFTRKFWFLYIFEPFFTISLCFSLFFSLLFRSIVTTKNQINKFHIFFPFDIRFEKKKKMRVFFFVEFSVLMITHARVSFVFGNFWLQRKHCYIWSINQDQIRSIP